MANWETNDNITIFSKASKQNQAHDQIVEEVRRSISQVGIGRYKM